MLWLNWDIYLRTKGSQFEDSLNCEQHREEEVEGAEDIHIGHGGPLKLEHEEQRVHDDQEQDEVLEWCRGA